MKLTFLSLLSIPGRQFLPFIGGLRVGAEQIFTAYQNCVCEEHIYRVSFPFMLLLNTFLQNKFL